MAIDTERTQTEREQYAEFLKGYQWDYFGTATWRVGDTAEKRAVYERDNLNYITTPRREPYHALKAVDRIFDKHLVVRGFVVAEPFQSGDLHTHFILGSARGRRTGELLMPNTTALWGDLYRNCGRSKVEPVRSAADVANYCAKYILKQQSRVCDYYHLYGTKLAWQRGKITDERL